MGVRPSVRPSLTCSSGGDKIKPYLLICCQITTQWDTNKKRKKKEEEGAFSLSISSSSSYTWLKFRAIRTNNSEDTHSLRWWWWWRPQLRDALALQICRCSGAFPHRFAGWGLISNEAIIFWETASLARLTTFTSYPVKLRVCWNFFFFTPGLRQ